jgi:hypothetical protein
MMDIAMRPLRLEPFTFVVGLVLIIGNSPIGSSLRAAFTPLNPNFDWESLVALSGGLLLLLSLALGTVRSTGSRSPTPGTAPRH